MLCILNKEFHNIFIILTQQLNLSLHGKFLNDIKRQFRLTIVNQNIAIQYRIRLSFWIGHWINSFIASRDYARVRSPY